ncbi:MAG: Rho termination factor N-terminal domain-containing protein [Bacilli bacterium]
MIAKDALNGKEVKKEEKKIENEVIDIAKLTVAELRIMAKEANIEGFSAMKKAELVQALNR